MTDTQYVPAREQNAVRAVLRNEITWIIFIIGLIRGAVQGIILPIQALQLGQSQIQVQIADIKNQEANLPQIQQDHAVMKQELQQLNTELQQHINQSK